MTKIYIACPRCGTGIASNCLKCRDPEWEHCKECVDELKERQINSPPNAQPSPWPAENPIDQPAKHVTGSGA